jgi:ribose 5-phosphate isomerase B
VLGELSSEEEGKGMTATPVSSSSATRVHIGGDHAAYELKEHLTDWLKREGYQVVDHGPHTYDPHDDYPPFVLRAAVAVASDPGSLGVVLGGSGNGEQIAANKVNGIRAALAWNQETAVLARQHNDANVISLGARQHSVGEVVRLLRAFLDARFSGEQRHRNRIEMLMQYETTGELPPLPDAHLAREEGTAVPNT